MLNEEWNKIDNYNNDLNYLNINILQKQKELEALYKMKEEIQQEIRGILRYDLLQQ